MCVTPQWDFSSMWPENSCGCCHWNYQQRRVQVFKIATDLCIIARRDQNSFVFPFLYNSPLISQQVKDDRQADMSVNPLHHPPLTVVTSISPSSQTVYWQYDLFLSIRSDPILPSQIALRGHDASFPFRGSPKQPLFSGTQGCRCLDTEFWCPPAQKMTMR